MGFFGIKNLFKYKKDFLLKPLSVPLNENNQTLKIISPFICFLPHFATQRGSESTIKNQRVPINPHHRRLKQMSTIKIQAPNNPDLIYCQEKYKWEAHTLACGLGVPLAQIGKANS